MVVGKTNQLSKKYPRTVDVCLYFNIFIILKDKYINDAIKHVPIKKYFKIRCKRKQIFTPKMGKSDASKDFDKYIYTFKETRKLK